jgi:hypothetical protein
MFKKFFSDQKDAFLYAKVCLTLMRDFGVDIKNIEKLAGENLVQSCGEFRQAGLNAESIAVIFLSNVFGFMKAYPNLNTGIVINERRWTIKS